MKHLKDFKIFEKVNEPKMEDSITKRLTRGVEQGYIESFDVDYDAKKLKIHFTDPKYAEDVTYNLETHYPSIWTGPNHDSWMPGKREVHRMDSDDMRKFIDLMNDTAKKFVKMNRGSGIVDDRGKVHPGSEALNLLKASNCEAYRKLVNNLQLFPVGGFKTGKIEFATKTYHDWHLNNPGTELRTSYSISKGGKIYKLSHPTLTMKSMPPLKSLKDYEIALQNLYDCIYTKPLKRWKHRFEKDPSVITKIPSVFIKDVAPKLASAANIGIFDGED